MKARRRLLAVLAAVAIIIVSTIVFLSTKPPTLVLPDGSTVSILKTSYGQSTHRLFHGSVLDRILYGWVPTEWLDGCRIGGPASVSIRRTIALRAMKHISTALANCLAKRHEQLPRNAAHLVDENRRSGSRIVYRHGKERRDE